MTHRLIIPFALHRRRWFIIRAHPSLSLSRAVICGTAGLYFFALLRHSLDPPLNQTRPFPVVASKRPLSIPTHSHTHTHRLFTQKNKNKRGEKGAIHKSQKQWPRHDAWTCTALRFVGTICRQREEATLTHTHCTPPYAQRKPNTGQKASIKHSTRTIIRLMLRTRILLLYILYMYIHPPRV